MKININKLSVTPPKMDFSFCVFGNPDEEVATWVEHWGFKTQKSGPFTNIIVPEGLELSQLFNKPKTYEYVDGFSPNLNKHLHIGHLSNLVLAKAFQSLGIGNSYIAILGNTLEGAVPKDEALAAFAAWCSDVGYKYDQVFFASEMKIPDHGIWLDGGTGKYENTLGFTVKDEKYIVAIKSSGDTTYFYQDAALAWHLKGSTLYLTGLEQEEHFKDLKFIFPHVEHAPLGLVTTKGKKISSREGNVIYATEVKDLLLEEFSDWHVAYNVLAGFILSSAPKSMKSIDMDQLSNVKLSPGLYFSYTAARLKSAGMEPTGAKDFHSHEIEYAYLKSLHHKNPNTLLEALKKLCKQINVNYGKYRIQGHPENVAIFSPQLDDLELGMNKLGMFSISKV